jgi:hypothetical protein
LLNITNSTAPKASTSNQNVQQQGATPILPPKKYPICRKQNLRNRFPFSLSFILKLQVVDGGEVFPCSPVLPFFNPQLKTLNYNSSDSRDSLQTWKKNGECQNPTKVCASRKANTGTESPAITM